jgi:hypothetical protein
MQATRSATTKTASAALAMTVTTLGLLLVDPGPIPAVRVAEAAKPIIILYPDSIEPVATLSPNGRRIEVTLGGRANDWTPGHTAQTDVVVTQPSTGAFAFGHLRSVPEQAGTVPDPLTLVVEAHAVAGSPPFEEGLAEACYFEEVRVRGQLVNSWSRCAEVLLLEED